MNLRQPIVPPAGFGPRPSMSFFLYNQNGRQAIARPYLEGQEASGVLGAAPPVAPEKIPKYHAHDSWDENNNAPSSNFIYDFERYRFFVRDSWREVFSHDAGGGVLGGSFNALVEAFCEGCEIKVGIKNLGADLSGNQKPMEHEFFIQTGPGYYNTQQQIFSAGSHPIVRVAPQIPLCYQSQNWDFGWLMLRSDGAVEYRRCDPYSLAFEDRRARYALRWFAR